MQKRSQDTHLDVDEHAVVRLVQNFVTLHVQRKLERNFCFAAGKFSWLHHFDGTVDDLDGLQGHAQVDPSARASCYVTVASESTPGRPHTLTPAPPPPSCCSGSLALSKLGSFLGLDAAVLGASRKCTDTLLSLIPKYLSLTVP